jgi:hypothetical protein
VCWLCVCEVDAGGELLWPLRGTRQRVGAVMWFKGRLAAGVSLFVLQQKVPAQLQGLCARLQLCAALAAGQAPR